MSLTPELFYLAVAAGLFGIGGGAVIVPALFFAFTRLGYSEDVVMHCAVATSAAVIVVNAVRSVKSHNIHEAVDWDLLWPALYRCNLFLAAQIGAYAVASPAAQPGRLLA